MRILFASHTAAGGVFTVGSHHLARELTALGHDVCHLSTPVSLLHLSRLRDPEVRRRFGLAVFPRSGGARRQYVPLTLLPMTAGRFLTSRLGLATAAPPVDRGLRRRGFAEVDVLVVDQPLLAGIEQHVRARVVVYRSTDLVESPAKQEGEGRVLAVADAVVATSQLVLDHLTEVRPDVPSLLLENGVEFDHFAGQGASSRQGAVYVGAIDERFDWDSVASMASHNPDVAVDVFGPVEDPPDDLPDNVSVRGAVSYDEAAVALRHARVGILPFKRTAMNRGRSPMKFYEYLAAGLNVVTTLPLQRNPPGVWAVPDEEAEGAALRHAIDAPPNASGVVLARSMDWHVRAAELADFLAELLEKTAADRSEPSVGTR